MFLRGKLERQRITDEALAEKERQGLIFLQAESAAVESTGQVGQGQGEEQGQK